MIRIDWKESGISKADMQRYERRLAPELARMRHAAASSYDDNRASINLCMDKQHVRLAKKLAQKHKGTALLIVVGIGGSNLGTIAVQEAVLGKLHNLHSHPQVLYADTVDTDSMTSINELLKKTLKAGKRAVLNIVSKSGGTTETVANAEVLIRTLKKYRKSYREQIVVTTDEGSKLWKLANNERFAVLPIPKKVGGRYSVFSPVGLFPLALLGIHIGKLLQGAAKMRTKCLAAKNNPAIIRAAMLAHARKKGKNIADNFYFKTDLESIGKWYRQLMGESVGKEWNATHKKRLWMGITPTVSIGTTDLHSMAQLYFGGPADKIHTIVALNKWRTNVRLPSMQQYDALVPHIQGKKLTTIMNAVIKGVAAVLRKQHRPFCIITLENSQEENIGELLQLYMMEMMYLGALLSVNPFDQPNVEVYKIETKRFLSK